MNQTNEEASSKKSVGERRYIEAVHRVARTLSKNLDVNEGLRQTLEVAVECVDAAGGTIYRHDAKTSELIFLHVVGDAANVLTGVRMPDTQGIAGHVFHIGCPLLHNDAKVDPQHSPWADERTHFQTSGMATIPLCYPGGESLGVMQLVGKQAGFTAEDLRALEIVADVSAMSLHKAELAERAARTEALGYVAGFAHDIYNKLASFVTGLPTLRLLLEEVFAQAEKGTIEGGAMDTLRADAESFIQFMERDADLLYRYARFIARLAMDKPLDTRFESADLRQTIAAQEPQLKRRARDLGVDLTFEDGAPVLCLHDALLLSSAVFNLVNNALPETRGGSVRVRVRTEEGQALIEVSDTGKGMPAPILVSILAGETLSSKPGGSGIGTLIVKRVAELHGGTLTGESAEGTGTTFRILLPLG